MSLADAQEQIATGWITVWTRIKGQVGTAADVGPDRDE